MTVETKTPPAVEWLVDGGEMATLIRSMDWTKTATSRARTNSSRHSSVYMDSTFEGTGISLATVHRIITRHGRCIWVNSEVDAAATFHFTLGGIP
jgi:hypothetical protein